MSTDRRPPKPDTPRGIEPRARRAADGSWTWRYRVRWTDPVNGTRRSEELDTVAEALDFQAHLRLARRRGTLDDLTRGEVLLVDFVEAEWWPNDAGRNLERSTLKTYAPIWNTHLEPRVGHLQLRRLTTPVVQQLREDMEADGVGAPTVRRALAVLQAICRYAIAKGHLTTNPVKEVRKPRVTRQRSVVAIAPTQIERLRSILTAGFEWTDNNGRRRRVTPTPASATLVSLIAYEGLRPEEALALTDDHVRKTTLLVEQRVIDGTIVRGQKGRRRHAARSHRSPELFAPVRADLAAHRLAITRPHGCDLVFPRPDGDPWRETDYRNWRRRVFKPAVELAGLPITRPYELRHACASLLLHARWPLPEIAEHLGHSVATLSDVYSHEIDDLKGQAIIGPAEAIAAARATTSTRRATA